MKLPAQVTNLMFTYQNPATRGWGEFIEKLRSCGKVSFLKGQGEIGTEGTEHVQGYAELTKKLRAGVIIELFKGAHVENRYGTQKEALHYVTKPHDGCECEHCVKARSLPNEGRVEGYDVEFGERKRARKSKTTKVTRQYIQAIRGGATDVELMDRWPTVYAQRPQLAKQVRCAQANDMTRQAVAEERPQEIVLIEGETRSLKTTYVQMKEGDSNVVSLLYEQGKVWLENYTGQSVLLVDEFAGQMRLQMLLKVLDAWHPCVYETKGGSVRPYFERIYVLANRPHTEWFRERERLTDGRDIGISRETIEAVYARVREGTILRFFRGLKPIREYWHPYDYYANGPYKTEPIPDEDLPERWLQIWSHKAENDPVWAGTHRLRLSTAMTEESRSQVMMTSREGLSGPPGRYDGTTPLEMTRYPGLLNWGSHSNGQ